MILFGCFRKTREIANTKQFERKQYVQNIFYALTNKCGWILLLFFWGQLFYFGVDTYPPEILDIQVQGGPLRVVSAVIAFFKPYKWPYEWVTRVISLYKRSYN